MKNYGKTFIGILVILAVMIGVCTGYFMDYYRPDETALSCLENGAEGVTVTTGDNGEIVFMPDDPQAGFVFYPGAKVDVRSYAPLMCSLAQKGICCAAVKPLWNFPLFSINAADGVKEQYPQISEWYIGGHSLGGVASSMYLVKHTEEYRGIILLGSYSSTDLSRTDLSALAVYGENDGVLDMESFEENESNLPQDRSIVCIPGGCHAGFGDYGAQKGDGIPSITAAVQQEITADTIKEWIETER